MNKIFITTFISFIFVLSFSCTHERTKTPDEIVKIAPYSSIVIPELENYEIKSGNSVFQSSESSSYKWLWPVSGQESGENIIMGPEEILFNDRSHEKEPFGGLVIGGKLGTPIISPENARIDNIIPYISFSVSPFTTGIADHPYITDLRKFYRSGSIEFSLEDGTQLAIRGIILDENLKVNQTISKGQVLGVLNHYFTFIPQPAIYIELLSDQDNRSSFFDEKDALSMNFLGQKTHLASLYEQIRNDDSIPLSYYYNPRQPDSVLKDETDKYPDNIIWPIKGKKPGIDVIIAPGEELLYSWYRNANEVYRKLLIGGSLGDEILAIESGHIIYEPDSYNLFPTPWEIWNGSKEELEDTLKKANLPKKFALGGSLTLELDDGRTISYNGIVPKSGIDTGSAITKGDVIGTLGYSYLFIPEPSVSIEAHVPSNGFRDLFDKVELFWYELTGRKHNLPELFDRYMSDDPVPQKPFDNPLFNVHLSIASLGEAVDFFRPLPLTGIIEDFRIFRETLYSYHPDLFHFINEKELEQLLDLAESKLHEGMTSLDFYKACYPIIRAIKGDHLFLDITVPIDQYLYLPLSLRVLNENIYVTGHSTNSTPELQEKFPVGTIIKMINGQSVEQILDEIKTIIFSPDGDTKAFEDYELLHSFSHYYSLYHLSRLQTEKNITMISDSGEEATVKFSSQYTPLPDSSYSSRIEFAYINMADREVAYYSPRGLGDYSGILDQKIPEMNEKGIENIIIDLRRNPGGNGPTAEKIFSMFYSIPFSYIKEKFATDSTQSLPDFTDSALNNNYKKIIQPSEIQYSGNVFILTDPYTLSAAGILANLFKQFDRGIIIGQGSGTPAGWINASQFKNEELPESGLKLRVPLVHTEYISNTDDGIIKPDYEIKISMADFLSFPLEDRDWYRLFERKILGVVEEIIKSNE